MATQAELITENSSAATEHTEALQSISTMFASTEHNTHYTHLAAVILDAAMERTASLTFLAARTEAWFNSLKQDVIDVTFVPMTRCDLVRRSAIPPAKKQRKGSVWSTSIESISRCVAAYHHAVIATEHDACEEIVNNINTFAHMICKKTDVSDQLLKLLHQWIENRSINIALRLSLDRCLEKFTFWEHITAEKRAQAVSLLETAMAIIRTDGEELRRCMDNLRNTVN